MDHVPINHPWVDESEAPIYRTTFPATTTDAELSAFCARLHEWGRKVRYPIAWVVDISRVREVPATQRKIFARHLEDFESFERRWNRGSALVVPNALVRGVVTAIFWLKKPVYPCELFAEPREARAWARARLQGEAPGDRRA